MEQQTGSKQEKEYVKAVYCHPAYLTSTQSTSWETLDWKKHKLESRLPGEISITSDMQMPPPYGRKWRGTKKPLSDSEVAQSCPTLCNPMDCSLLGSSVHGIFQAIVLEWIAISFSSGSSWPRDQTRVSRIVDRHFTVWATREVLGKVRRG